MYRIKLKNSVKSDLRKINQSNLKKQFEEIFDTLKNDPYEHSQSVEKLMPKNSNIYSRRLNSQHRVVYEVDEKTKTVYIASAWSHYK